MQLKQVAEVPTQHYPTEIGETKCSFKFSSGHIKNRKKKQVNLL